MDLDKKMMHELWRSVAVRELMQMYRATETQASELYGAVDPLINEPHTPHEMNVLFRSIFGNQTPNPIHVPREWLKIEVHWEYPFIAVPVMPE